SASNREHFQTQVEYLKSREVALRTIQELNLTEHPMFDLRQREPSLVSTILSSIGFGSDQEEEGADVTAERIEDYAVARVTDGLQVAPVRMSQLIRVSFDSPDRNLAADMASSIVMSYIQADMDAREQMNQTAIKWL